MEIIVIVASVGAISALMLIAHQLERIANAKDKQPNP